MKLTAQMKMANMFPQLAGLPNILEDAVEYLVEHAVECDEAAGSGWNALIPLVNGDVDSSLLREAVEQMMTRDAGHMLDACRGVVVSAAVDSLDEDDVTHYFKIKALYDGLSNAGLV